MSIAQTFKAVKEKETVIRKNVRLFSFAKKQTASFLFGLLFGFSKLFEGFAPFGVAYSSAAKKSSFPAALLGTAVGYILKNDPIDALRYCAALMALGVIFGAIKPLKTLSESVALPSVLSFLCLFVTGLAIAFSKEIGILSLLSVFSEALLGSVAAYLFLKVRCILSLKGSFFGLSSKEAVSVVIAGSVLLLSIKDLSLFGIYPSHVLAVLVTLFCAFYSREAGGAVVGICCGTVLSLGSGNLYFLAFCAFGGLVAGVVSGLGRIAVYLAFSFCAAAVTVAVKGETPELSFLLEIAASGVLFLLMPKKITAVIERALTPSSPSPAIDSIKGRLMRRLKNAAEMSEEICESLTAVSGALLKNEKTELSAVCKKTKDAVCGSCGLYDSCWREAYEQTQDSFNTLLSLKKEGVYLEYKSVPSVFSGKCIRTEMVASSINKLYSEYKLKERLNARIGEIHTSAARQFINVSSLLSSLCENVSGEVRFDCDLASKAASAAGACDYEVLKSTCVTDEFDRLTVEITVKTKENANCERLLRQLEAVTDRKLSSPEVYVEGKTSEIIFKERPKYRAVFSGSVICCNTEKYSGDTYSVFFDGDGCVYAVICDGMGTGMRAAVNSNLAVSLLEKLIKAGFGIQSSVNTVNTSLISKSGDECSVTLDLLRLDLYTGHVDFYKCGASPTYVKKQGRVLAVDCPSLPLGILSDVEINSGTGTLSSGDVIVMVSDGVGEEDIPLLKSELKSFYSGNVREFCDGLTGEIKELHPGKNDDITVLTLAVTEY